METHSPVTAGKPDAVGLYGLDFHIWSVIQLCREAGIGVSFVVDNRPEESSDYDPASLPADAVRAHLIAQNIPVWSMQQLREAHLNGQIGVPLVSASITTDYSWRLDRDRFHRAVGQVRDLLGEAVRLWHPVTLAGALRPPTHRRRFGLIGFPGSGNVLAHHVLEALVEKVAEPVPPALQCLAVAAELYFVSQVLFIRERLRLLVDAVDVQFNAGEFPTMTVTMKMADGGHAGVLHVPSNRHLAQDIYHSHSTPSADIVADFERMHTPLFVVLRHPFESVVSVASKIARPPTQILDDLRWLDQFAAGLALWHRRLDENWEGLTVLRYEDLVARQPTPVQCAAERLGTAISDGEIQLLYDKLLFRNLDSRAPDHFHQGTTDKWRRYFGAEHLERFFKHGFERYLEHWGYEWLGTEATPPRPQAGLAQPFAQQIAGAIPVMMGTAEWSKWKPLPGMLPLSVRCSPTVEVGKLAAFFQGHELLELLDAGGIGPNPPEWCWRIRRAALRSDQHLLRVCAA